MTCMLCCVRSGHRRRFGWSAATSSCRTTFIFLWLRPQRPLGLRIGAATGSLNSASVIETRSIAGRRITGILACKAGSSTKKSGITFMTIPSARGSLDAQRIGLTRVCCIRLFGISRGGGVLGGRGSLGGRGVLGRARRPWEGEAPAEPADVIWLVWCFSLVGNDGRGMTRNNAEN